MRFEATIPDSRATAANELAQELGLSRSQLMDEALALFLKAVMEVRRGRRLVTLGPDATQPACELASPTLSALEWAQRSTALTLSEPELDKLTQLTDAPPAANAQLREAARRQRR